MIPADTVPIAAPGVPPTPPVAITPDMLPKTFRRKRIMEDIERPVTPQELQEANAGLKLDDDTAKKIRELREDILQGRVKATEPRKIELGFLPETKVQIKIPKKGISIRAKYTNEDYERYLETARRLDEQKKKRIAEAIGDVLMKQNDE